MEDKFDVIIVGAGVAGSTAALQLARQGLQVVLIERGPYPGSKNLSGGVLYGRILEQVIPNYWEEAPIERCITNQTITFMTGEAHFSIDFKSQSFSRPPYNAFTVLRGKFDRWLAEKAEAAGAMLVPGIRVDNVLKEDGRVVGVVAGEEEMRADVVIAADGAFSFITQAAGLREKPPAHHNAIGVKQLIGLPRETIEERFRLVGDEGAAYAIVGYATRGVSGGGFLYTNKDSLSVGLVMKVDDLVKNKVKSGEMLEEFLQHPMLVPLLKGGRLLEYGAHIVPEGGMAGIPRLYADGILVVGDAAGLGVNTGFVVRGMDLAIGSGICAAEAIVEAKAQNDFSAKALSAYRQKLDQSYVMADMRTYARAPHFFEKKRLYTTYPEFLADLMTRIYTENAAPQEHLLPLLMKSAKENDISLFELARDMMEGARAL